MVLVFIIHHSLGYYVCTHINLFFTFFLFFNQEISCFKLKKKTTTTKKSQTYTACISISVLLMGKLMRNKFYMLCTKPVCDGLGYKSWIFQTFFPQDSSCVLISCETFLSLLSVFLKLCIIIITY